MSTLTFGNLRHIGKCLAQRLAELVEILLVDENPMPLLVFAIARNFGYRQVRLLTLVRATIEVVYPTASRYEFRKKYIIHDV